MTIVIDYLTEKRPIEVGVIIRRAGELLNDADHIRWTIDELIDWINEAVIAIINANPAAGERDAILTLNQGARQELDGSVCQLMTITCNVDADGNAGRAITRAGFSLMNLSAPEWQTTKPAAKVRQYLYEDRAPSVFYVYPPALAGTQVRASLAEIPDDVTTEGDNVPLKIEYADAVLNYVCYRCLSKDSEASNGAIATAFYGAFQQAMGNESSGAEATSPNRNKA